jgi:hypothetical protein
VLQSHSSQVFHGDKGFAIFFAEVMNSANVWMAQRGGGLGFASKVLQGLMIVGQLCRQKFQGEEAVEPGVLSLLDHSHAATTEFFYDAIVQNRLPDERISP